MKRTSWFILLLIILACCFVADILMGSVQLSLPEVWRTLTGSSDNVIYHEIIINHRLPKAITAILTGAALAASGVLMQTLFGNPLAGPDILGVTSGASLGVAILTMSTAYIPFVWLTGWGPVLAAIIGACLILLLVVVAATRIKQTTSLLIIGLMFGYFTSGIVSVLQSMSNPDTLKLFINWTFGSLSSVSWVELRILFPVLLAGLILTLLLQKQLNIFLLGENYARGLGVAVSRLRLWVIIATALLAGTSTAFTGPISFIGITMPHIARRLFSTPNHRIVLPASMLCGAILLLICDLISQMPGFQSTLPINAVTAFFGAPIIIWIIWKKRY